MTVSRKSAAKAGKATATTAIWSGEGSEVARSTTGTPTQRIPKIEAAHFQGVVRKAFMAVTVSSRPLAHQWGAS